MASADDTIAKIAAQQAGAARAAQAMGELAKAAQAAAAALGVMGDAGAGATSKVEGNAGKMATAISGAGKVIKSAGAMMATAISGVGAAFAALASSPAPTAMQAMQAFGSVAGGMISGAGAALSSGLSAIGDKLSMLGPEGAVAGAALEAVGAAAQAATAALDATIGTVTTLMGLAIEVTQRLDIMRDRFAGLAGSAAGGAAVEGVVAKLAKTLPFATSQVQAWAQSLLVAGLQGNELEAAIKAVAAAQALMGESGGQAAQNMIARLAMGGAAATKLMADIQKGGRRSAQALLEMGLNMRDVAAAAGMSEAAFKSAHLSAEQMQKAIEKALAQKGGGALADMALTFESIAQKAREGILSIFAKLGPAVQPFMKAVMALFGQFNKGTPIIGALQKIATEVFGAIFKYATKAVQAVSAFIRENFTAKSIGAMWAQYKGIFVAIGTAIVTVAKFVFALVGAFVKWAKTKEGATAIKATLLLVAAALAAIVTVVGALVAIIAIPFIITGGAIVGLLVLLGDMMDGLSGIGDTISSIDIAGAFSGWVDAASDAASALIDGLVGGIEAGAGAIVSAVTGLASGAINAFKGALQIASPSRVMMGLGGHMATGVAEGVDAGAPKAQAATAAMVDPKALKVGGAKGGGAGKSVTFTGCTFGSVSESQIREWTMKALDEDGYAGPEASPA